jgi:tetratricopeptide (TPR) repeat protein
MATSERVHAGVQAVVRHALSQGWLTGGQLREALLLQEQLRTSGQPVELLPILRGRYLRPEHVAALTQVYREALGPAGGDTLPLPAPALPREALERSSEAARRPRAEDPPRVRDFLRQSGQGEDVLEHTLADRSARPSERARAADRIGGYRLVRELARGGMGVVYHAHSLSLDRPVALKVMRDALAPDPEDVERFLLEARAAARLRHPGIVGVHEVGQDEGRWFIAMDLVEGESLKARVLRDGPLPAREAAKVALGLARALAYAHERSILHRDVKPANVLLGEDGAPLLTDFGLAKDVGAGREERGLTATGMAVGTPAYMPPEQAEGDASRVDRRADVYGAGATLFEMLVGRAPFGGKTALSVLEAVINQAPPRPSAARPDLDRDLETICLTCLEKDPARRYGSADALADDLEAYLAHRPIRARPVGPLGRAARWARRHPVAAGTLCVVALLALTSGVGAWAWQAGLARARAEDLARRRAGLERVLERHDAGDPAADLVRAAASEDAALVVAVLGPRLEALADDLRALGRALYLEAGSPDEGERAAGLSPVEGLAGAVDAWVAGAVSPAQAAALRAAEERLARRAARGTALQPPTFAELVTARASEALGPRLLAADAVCVALGRAGPGAVLPLARYLDALHDGERAVAPAQALCETGDPRGQEAVLRALRRLGERGPSAAPLRRALERVRADVTLAGDGARAHLERAQARLDKDDLAGAIDDATRALALEPDLGAAWTLRARARLRERRGAEGALEDARRAVELAPEDEEAWLALGNAHRRRHHVQEALAAFERAVEVAPESAWALHARAQGRLAAHDRAGARDDAERAVELAPRDAKVRVGRAFVRVRLRDLTGALADLDDALELDPAYASAHADRGVLRYHQGKLEEAFADLTRAIELAPDDWGVAPGALANRALIKRDRGDLAGAEVDVEAALRLDPDLARALMTRGALRDHRGDHAGARADLDRAVALDPEDAELLAVRGWQRWIRGDPARGLADLDRAVEVDDEAVLARLLRGKARLEAGQLERAREDLEAVTRLEDRAVEAWTSLAELHGRQGDLAARDRCLKQALALSPNYGAMSFELGKVRAENGEWAEAEQYFTKALEAKDDAPTRVERGFARHALGRGADARADFDRALELDASALRAWVGRAAVRRLAGDEAGAEEDLARAVERSARPLEAWTERAAARAQLGDYRGALEDVERALALGGEREARLFAIRGGCLQLLGDPAGAVAAYERLLELDPRSDDAAAVRRMIDQLREAAR